MTPTLSILTAIYQWIGEWENQVGDVIEYPLPAITIPTIEVMMCAPTVPAWPVQVVKSSASRTRAKAVG